MVNQLGKQLNLLDYAISSLFRNKLKNGGIFVVFAGVIFLFASLQLMTRGLTEASHIVLKGVPDITVQQMSAGRQISLDTSAMERLQSIYGITSITPRVWGYYFDEANGANYTVVGLKSYGGGAGGNTLSLREGRMPVNRREVVMSEQVRDSMVLGDRRSFSLFTPDLSLISFTSCGTFSEKGALSTADMMLMSISDARDLFGMNSSAVTDLLINVGNARETDTIAARISEKLPGSRVITRKQIMKTYDVVFSWRSGFGALCLLTSLAAFVILAYDRASGLTKEDLREVGILKILGWQATDVMAVRFWESGIISVLALVCGYFLAWIHIVWWHGWLFKPLLLGWSVLRPEFAIVPPFLMQDLLLLFSISVLPYLCATVVPAWRSAVVRPDSVI